MNFAIKRKLSNLNQMFQLSCILMVEALRNRPEGQQGMNQ
jgi:hypothetical protein